MSHGGAAGHRAARELVTPQRLREFFAPRSIALVGASDNSGWARFIVASCATAGFAGPLRAVHPRARSAFGLPVVPSLRDAGPTDLAFILAPVQAVESVLDDMAAAVAGCGLGSRGSPSTRSAMMLRWISLVPE